MPIVIKFDSSAVESVVTDAGLVIDDAVAPAMKKIGVLIQGEAIERANISPTKAQYEKEHGKTKRTNFNPGGLERSIKSESNKTSASVFVASNAEASGYAFKIHSQKGIKWARRGPGTRAKGKQADHMFILRAIKDNAKDIEEFLAKSIDAFLVKMAKSRRGSRRPKL